MHGVTKLQLLLSKADLRLHADSQRMAQGWEQGLRAGVDGAFFSATSITPPFKLRAGSRVAGITAAIAEAMQHVVGYWLARASAIISTLPVLSRKRKKTAINIRRWMAVAASTVGCTLAVAGTLVVKGYRDHPADFWTKRLGELTQSAIYDRDGNFMGSVSMSAMQDDPEQSRRYGFVPLMGPIPPVYLAALLHAENRRYHDGGIHNICGLDPLSSIKSFLWSGGSAGGSTIAQQLARGLKPEWQGQTRMWEKIPRKFMELGAACSLHQTLVDKNNINDGGEDGLLRAYASYAPAIQGAGSLRGIESASQVIWGSKPLDLNAGQQLLLAATAQKPLVLQSTADLSVACELVHPRRNNPKFSVEVAKKHPARAGLCKVLSRADWMADNVLSDGEKEIAHKEIDTVRRDGLNPAPFERVPAKRLINLTSRTASLMPTGLLRQVIVEADAAEVPLGAPLQVTVDAKRATQFTNDIKAALGQAQKRAGAVLCLPLLPGKTAQPVGRCKSPGRSPHAESAKDIQADILAVSMDAANGGIESAYVSSPLLMDARQSMGSLNKLIILLAAIKAGYTADSRICPRAARTNGRQLRRVAQPTYGYAHCKNGENTITLRDATATSDNLVFYELAREIGEPGLRSALVAMGLSNDDDPDEATQSARAQSLAYPLSFGTQGMTPKALLNAAQALFAVAYELKVTGRGPRILANNQASTENRVASDVANLIGAGSASTLRELLEAPVQHSKGTLRMLQGNVTAGKSGTTSSTVADGTGRQFVHGKLSIGYDQVSQRIYLLMVTAPLPSIPLGQHYLGARVFEPIYNAFFQLNEGRS